MHNSKTKAQPTDDIESSVYRWCGESSKKGLIFNDKWSSPFGKNNRFRFIGNPDRTFGTIFDHKERTSQTFFLKGISKTKIKLPTKPPAPANKIDFEAKFLALKKCKTHPYLTAKKVKALNFFKERDYRGTKNNPGKALCVPFKSCKTKELAGWQYFWANGEKEFVKGKIEGPVYLFIEGHNKDGKIHVCEGISTALSINSITSRGVYCSFGKANMDAVAEMALNKHKNHTIAISGDKDKKDQYYPNKKLSKDKRVVFLIPEAIGDWNDFQHNSLERAKLITLDKDRAKMMIPTKEKSIKIKQIVSFFSKFLLHFEFNFFFGDTKIGKTRCLIYLILKALLQKENKGKKCAILSTDNDPETTLGRLFMELRKLTEFKKIKDIEKTEFFDVMDSNLIRKINEMTDPTRGLIKLFLKNIDDYLAVNKDTICLLIDPLPTAFIDWNKETLAGLAIDGLRILAKKHKVCIIGVRNEGKNKEYETSQAYKGSSGIGDSSRQLNRALKVHPKSALGKDKEINGKQAVALYTERSSLFGNEAFLFKLDITPDDFAVPIFVKMLDKNTEKVKYLCERKSGSTIASKIFHFINSQKSKGCSLDDLYEEFNGIHTEDSIRKVGKAHFDYIEKGKAIFFTLNSTKK